MEQIEIKFSPEDDGLEGSGVAEGPEAILRRLGVEVPRGRSREFVYTDRGQARWSGETGRPNTSACHGLSLETWKYVEDWVLALDDTLVAPDAADRAVVFPHKLVRHYPSEDTLEEVFFCEEIGALVVVYTTRYRGPFRFVPRFDVRHIWKTGRHPHRAQWRPEHNLLAVTHVPVSPEESAAPLWVGVSSSEQLSFVENVTYFAVTYPRDARRGVMGEGHPYQAGLLKGRCRTGRVTFIFALAEEEQKAADLARQVLARRQEYALEHAARISRLLKPAPAGTGDEELERALRWAAISLDGLVMNQQGRGIYAGLPCFPNYWSRDTFVSLPALLCLGQFEPCRAILLSAVEHQVEDFQSPDYGRLANLVSPGDVHHNTADGTWWFVLAAHAYVRYTGEVSLAREILPWVIRAVEGEIRKRTDEHGFSIHGDGETWMDAAFEGQAWSPRGNRAVEVQALWHGALVSGADLAEWAGESRLAGEWRGFAEDLKRRFAEQFWDARVGCLYDHLNADGTPDRKPRPNQVFALVVSPEDLLSFEQQRAVLDSVVEKLVYPHGVGSLAPEDPDFHPRHIDLDRYPFDAAYHNGDVWVWLSGIVMTAMVRQGRAEAAWQLMRSLVSLVHEEGAVGTLPELRDAVPPADGKPNVEGTVTQAWSLAEFIRPFHQDFLGLKPWMVERRVEVEPALPDAISGVQFSVKFGDVRLEGLYRLTENVKRARFEARAAADPVTLSVRFRVPGGKRLVTEAPVLPSRAVEVAASKDSDGRWEITVDGRGVPFRTEETPFDVAKEIVPEYRVPPG